MLFRNANPRTAVTIPLSLALVVALTFAAIHNFRQPCDDTDLPTARAQAFRTHQGVEPTDEYTPNQADNDVLRADNPPFWFSPNPAAFAPGTTPNPATFIQPQSAPPDTQSATRAPQAIAPLSSEPATFTVDAPSAGYLILNLREYPNWDIAVDDPNSTNRLRTAHVPRDDGLIAVPLYHGGHYTAHIAWHRTLDQQLGLALSAIAACIYTALLLRARSRRIVV
jgi:hypothetical protein